MVARRCVISCDSVGCGLDRGWGNWSPRVAALSAELKSRRKPSSAFPTPVLPYSADVSICRFVQSDMHLATRPGWEKPEPGHADGPALGLRLLGAVTVTSIL